MNRSVLGRTIAVIATLALVAGFLAGLSHFPRPEEDARAILASLVLPDLEGEPMPMTQWRGKVVVVSFWASWCPPCRDEVPGLTQTQRELGANGLQVVGIAVDSADQAKAAAAEWGISYPILVGGAAAIDLARRLGNPAGGLPYTVVVDRSGALVASHLGVLSQANLARVLAAPLGL